MKTTVYHNYLLANLNARTTIRGALANTVSSATQPLKYQPSESREVGFRAAVITIGGTKSTEVSPSHAMINC